MAFPVNLLWDEVAEPLFRTEDHRQQLYNPGAEAAALPNQSSTLENINKESQRADARDKTVTFGGLVKRHFEHEKYFDTNARYT